MDELLRQPVRQLASAIKERQITSAALTRAFLDRIESVNPGLNAVIRVEAELAMKYAERADIALKGGETPGPLFGVPMTIKDSLNTFDMVSTWGTKGRENFRPGKDATVVGRLRDAGAILMGKTNTPEFTLDFKADNLLFGRTNNPYDIERTSGGSSGGAAAAIATNMTPFDVGTDTGGSIRLPAHFSGICGIKPTTGLLPCTGNSLPSAGLIAPLTQPGPMANYVDDLIYLLDIMRGPDNLDPHARHAPWQDPQSVDIQRLRIGYHTDNGIRTPDSSTVDCINHVVDLMQGHNSNVQEARPVGVEMASFIFAHVMSADNGDLVNALLEESGTNQPSPPVARIIERQSDGISANDFAQVISLWHNYQSSNLGFFDDHDVLICPVNGHTAIPHDEPEDFRAYTYTAAYNLTGWPGVVIRAGTDEQGLPIGVQILASPFREDRALAVACWLESKLGPFEAPTLA